MQDPISVEQDENASAFDLYNMKRNRLLDPTAPLPNAEPPKFSDKEYGVVKAFGACTNQGLLRNYNEDRVSIVLNILPPPGRNTEEKWPNCNFFGIFDGHGGNKCSEFLRNNLHQYVINFVKQWRTDCL